MHTKKIIYDVVPCGIEWWKNATFIQLKSRGLKIFLSFSVWWWAQAIVTSRELHSSPLFYFISFRRILFIYIVLVRNVMFVLEKMLYNTIRNEIKYLGINNKNAFKDGFCFFWLDTLKLAKKNWDACVCVRAR